ncbi:hypothetical protein P3T76_014445 [Phytophthora citrophthora]|uniref:Uncharacterized protein n=1 Tax=Phytophthora citrophthora TaxID=4793 RepID=A0AAD9G1I6_9STRA|nr:hypothetical protein P3T76_014445 [Phytophthora citrophthora]
MTFAEMLPVPSSQMPTQWVAPPAASWTHEEISMIQEMFLSDEKSIQIRDISISGGKQPVDPMAFPMEQGGDATSMLLSPIGADDAFLQQFMVDEKDAMAAFFLEAIDPFEHVPVASNKEQEAAVAGPCDGRPVEHVLAKLRAKVDGLSRIYYSRCMNASNVDDSSINKTKLVLAIERLQRVIQGLTKENTQLKTDITSCTQRSELLLQGSTVNQEELAQLSQSIDESKCATAVDEGVKMALNCSMDGEVLKDHQDEHGWSYKSVEPQDGVFTYTLNKQYPKEVDMNKVMQKTRANVSSSENFSGIYYGSVKAQLVKKLGKQTVILYDMTNHDATRVDRVVAVLFRVEMPNGFLLGARSISATPVSTSDNTRPMNCTTWQRYERKEDGGFSVTSGGQLTYPSRADIDFMAVEILCLHLRWENRVVGAQLTM